VTTRKVLQRQLTEFLAAHDATERPPPQFIDEEFPAQAAFIRDPSRQKAALCTRRAGKSFGIACYLFKEAYENPGVQCLYLALTRPSAKAIMWPLMNKVNKFLDIGARFHHTDLTITLPNGSTIKLSGADANEEQMQRLLGQANKLIAIDECASFKPYIRTMVYEVLKPTLVDYAGTIVLIGTPGTLSAGLFFDITTGTEAGWSIHRWNTYDNPYMVHNWTDEVAQLRALNPHIDQTPGFRRHYLGEWVIDDENSVYKFNPSRNLYTELPQGEFTYILGVDLGWEDPTAIVLGAYSDTSPHFYIVDVWKKQYALLSEVAAKINGYMESYAVAHVVVDDASKQAVEDMRARFAIPFEAAIKRGKYDFIGIMNDDFVMGHIKLCEETGQELIEEYGNLIWQLNAGGVRSEDVRCENHIADAALYCYRHAKHYLADEPVDGPYEGEGGMLRMQEDQLEKFAEQKWKQSQSEDYQWWEYL